LRSASRRIDSARRASSCKQETCTQVTSQAGRRHTIFCGGCAQPPADSARRASSCKQETCGQVTSQNKRRKTKFCGGCTQLPAASTQHGAPRPASRRHAARSLLKTKEGRQNSVAVALSFPPHRLSTARLVLQAEDMQPGAPVGSLNKAKQTTLETATCLQQCSAARRACKKSASTYHFDCNSVCRVTRP
jgi:hypothetical protein